MTLNPGNPAAGVARPLGERVKRQLWSLGEILRTFASTHLVQAPPKAKGCP